MEFPDFLRPHCRLFFSIDIVGSTRSKQSVYGNQQVDDQGTSWESIWYRDIAIFYRLFSDLFDEEYKDLPDQVKDTKALPNSLEKNRGPELWKLKGDEVLFSHLIGSEIEIPYYVGAWLRALRRFPDEFRRQVSNDASTPECKGPNLEIKGTAWIGGFPVTNREIAYPVRFWTTTAGTLPDFPESIGDDIIQNYWLLNYWYERLDLRHNFIKDYVGPMIDSGFRLTGLSTPRKAAISIELAYFLAKSQSVLPKERFLPIVYEGRVQIPGVLEDNPYPFLWLDTMRMLSDEERLDDLIYPNYASSDKLLIYCQKFFEHHHDLLRVPFVWDGTDEHYRALDNDFKKKLETMLDKWRYYKSLLEENIEAKNRSAAGSVVADEPSIDVLMSDPDLVQTIRPPQEDG